MSETVKRYNMDLGRFGNVDSYESEHGRWVKHGDYARLEQDYAELVERYGKLQTGEGHITHRVIAEREAALKQTEFLRSLLMEAKASLDPFDDKLLEARIDAALSAKP